MPPKKPTAATQPSSKPDMDNLLSYTIRTQTLLTQLLTSVTNPPTSIPTLPPDQRVLNPLTILRDSGKLLHAHTTKLSLMIMNKPFGAKSMTAELKACVEKCIMGMMGAVDILSCSWHPISPNSDNPGSADVSDQSIWGDMMIREARTRVARVIREMLVMVQELRTLTETEAGILDSPSSDAVSQRDNLSSTGVVWEACDSLVALEKLSLPGLAVMKATQYHQTLKDALAELKEWAEEVDGDEADFSDEGFSDEDDELDAIFGASKRLPKNDTALREQVERTNKKLSSIAVLYQALIKRRLKPFIFTFPPSAATEHTLLRRTKRLNQIIDELKSIPDEVDELAGALYELDGGSAEARLKNCIDMASEAAALAKLNWDGQEDEFTVWSGKWKGSVES
ncbi:hypothetical protein EJ05DRAFT_473860 [Pseudovirgaria hyperparasitica]|uniref:Cyclin-D1-binding protein 1-like N-terminal domain-containing protein n=1 Tax=Pseudovirgaria hyperparasitica TaxID=470096 RepID=A0A6A6WJ77_9PEZI|nr:uncharacterized protein EJ05DRAFT_473860 [Pseudovirgaria hyperparasitica]KAF2761341.1 hypothetical protein EJ05DRAFT_473860 [Pseudovirgaria hyperparasitica]